MKDFWAFDKAVFKAGALDVLQKQLMAVAVALAPASLTTQQDLLALAEAGGLSRVGCRSRDRQHFLYLIYLIGEMS